MSTRAYLPRNQARDYRIALSSLSKRDADRFKRIFPDVDIDLSPTPHLAAPLQLEAIERMEAFIPWMIDWIAKFARTTSDKLVNAAKKEISRTGWAGMSFYHVREFMKKWESTGRDYDVYVEEWDQPGWKLSPKTLYDTHMLGREFFEEWKDPYARPGELIEFCAKLGKKDKKRKKKPEVKSGLVVENLVCWSMHDRPHPGYHILLGGEVTFVDKKRVTRKIGE